MNAGRSPWLRSSRIVRVLAVALVLAVVLGAALGSVDIPPSDVLSVVLAHVGLSDAANVPESSWNILTAIRFPRVLLLALVGGALAVCGAALQATFQNGLAAPSVVGVSGGGALGAVLALRLGLAQDHVWTLPLLAFIGAFLSAGLVYVLAHVGGRPSITALLLTGVAMGTLTTAAVSLILVLSEEYRMRMILVWLVGGAEGRSWEHVGLAAGPILLGTACLVSRHRELDGLSLGHEHALSIGLEVRRVRLFVIALTALVAGAAVSVAGPIGFVGLIVPNALRFLVGPMSRVLLPSSFLGGAAFLVACDLLARLASPQGQELPVGIVTSFCGVPFFLLLLARAQRSVR